MASSRPRKAVATNMNLRRAMEARASTLPRYSRVRNCGSPVRSASMKRWRLSDQAPPVERCAARRLARKHDQHRRKYRGDDRKRHAGRKHDGVPASLRIARRAKDVATLCGSNEESNHKGEQVGRLLVGYLDLVVIDIINLLEVVEIVPTLDNCLKCLFGDGVRCCCLKRLFVHENTPPHRFF